MTYRCFPERLKTNSQRHSVSPISVAAVLSSHRVRRAFRRSAKMAATGSPTPRSLKSEYPIRERPGGFQAANPK